MTPTEILKKKYPRVEELDWYEPVVECMNEYAQAWLLKMFEDLPSELAKHLAGMNKEFGIKKRLTASDYVAIGKVAYFTKTQTDKFISEQKSIEQKSLKTHRP